jgi:Na+-translocating ferredoxin:NAD+ oxidoreductase subunit B
MSDEHGIYRALQQNLDCQAVAFPATGSGADIRLLKRLFSPDEARIASRMSYKPASLEQIVEKVGADFSAEETERLLNSMFMKGGIGWKKKDGVDCWHVMPLVVGMYEAQGGRPSPAFLADADAYMKTMAFGKSFLGVKPSQMRTIPVNKSIPVEHHVATYDQIREIVKNSPGPFVALKCICRETMAMRGKPCKKTSRMETCMGFGNVASTVLRRKQGREVDRDEALAILQTNEDDGLVLQPANAKKPEFVCSCCGCCCGMLSFQKFLPHPVDFWTTNFYAEVATESCSSCRKCSSRCQVGAVTMTGPDEKATINLSRCIGCGLCVPTCPSKSIRLKKKETEAVLPEDEEALYDKIMENKPNAFGRFRTLMKVALKMRQ